MAQPSASAFSVRRRARGPGHQAERGLDQRLQLRSTSGVVPETPGTEWLVDAFECTPEALRSRDALETVFARIVDELDLHPAEKPVWHVFPGEAGVTGLWLLSESHLACHTFPERRFAAFNLYCCRPRQEWPWQKRLHQSLGAAQVTVRHFLRGEP